MPATLFENNALIKNDKSFWVPAFFKKAAALEAFEKSFTKNVLMISGCFPV
ncbi:hypothetical protein [Komagataeibacter xylinus]|uniref:hypothetical protein n=1 Tax=Komagataeibacter xylinus TaxID=28448 RepID=UPI0012E8DDA5|nr:hypothetical protein [Komagataeibacter xylinus]